MEECNTGVTIVKTSEECDGNYTSTNCIATPNAITYLDLSSGASQTSINAALVSALMRKDEQISEIPIANGSETKIIAGEGITVTGTGTNVSNYIISSTNTYSQKVVSQTQGIYDIIESDNNKGIIIENLDNEEGLEIIVNIPTGLSQGFKTKILKRQTGIVRILPENFILRPNSTSNEIGNINDWVYIEKLGTTNTFIINGGLGLPS